MAPFKLIAMFSILAIALAGGYYPLRHPQTARQGKGFPQGEAFAAGVFLALALLMMLPSAFHLFNKIMPSNEFPLAAVLAILSFSSLLAIEQWAEKIQKELGWKPHYEDLETIIKTAWNWHQNEATRQIGHST